MNNRRKLVIALGAGALTAPLASFEQARWQFERDYLVRQLKITAGNVSNAAKLVQRNRPEFYKLLQRHALDPAAFKSAAP